MKELVQKLSEQISNVETRNRTRTAEEYERFLYSLEVILKDVWLGTFIDSDYECRINKNVNWYSQNQPTGQTGPQGQVFTPGSEITPNPAFYGRMDQLFAQRGCNGLLKRLQKFNNNMAGLVPGYNERWRSMLMMKINYMEKMIADNC